MKYSRRQHIIKIMSLCLAMIFVIAVAAVAVSCSKTDKVKKILCNTWWRYKIVTWQGNTNLYYFLFKTDGTFEYVGVNDVLGVDYTATGNYSIEDSGWIYLTGTSHNNILDEDSDYTDIFEYHLVNDGESLELIQVGNSYSSNNKCETTAPPNI